MVLCRITWMGTNTLSLGGIYGTLFIERMTENGLTFITVPTWMGKVSLSVSSAVFPTKKENFLRIFYSDFASWWTSGGGPENLVKLGQHLPI